MNTVFAASGSARIVVGLEITTCKICAAVTEQFPDGTIKLLGIGQAFSRGVRQNGITDFDWAKKSVLEALRDAKVRSGVAIHRVTLAVTGAKVAAHDEVTWEDIFEWEDVCYAEGDDGVLRSVNLVECKRTPGLKVVRGAGARIANNIRCLNDLGVEVERIVFAPAASAEAVLSAQQKQLGALVIDMGFGTTDYAVYSCGDLVQSDSLPAGGENIAKELSRELRIPMARAEKLVIGEGSVCLGLSSPNNLKRIVLGAELGFPAQEIERETLNTIVHHHVEQAFYLLKSRLRNSGVRLDPLGAGIQFTGGGSLIPGSRELAEKIFELPTQRASLRGILAEAGNLTNPRLSCVVGLTKLA